MHQNPQKSKNFIFQNFCSIGSIGPTSKVGGSKNCKGSMTHTDGRTDRHQDRQSLLEDASQINNLGYCRSINLWVNMSGSLHCSLGILPHSRQSPLLKKIRGRGGIFPPSRKKIERGENPDRKLEFVILVSTRALTMAMLRNIMFAL